MVLSPSNVSITIALLYCLAYFIKKKKTEFIRQLEYNCLCSETAPFSI